MMIHKRCVDYTVIALTVVPFVLLFAGVLVNDDYLNSTGIGKGIPFFVAMACVPWATSVSYLYHRKSVKYHPVDLLLALFVLLGVSFSYLNHPEINTRLIIMLLLLLLYYCLRIFLVQHPIHKYILLLVIIVTAGLEASWGLLQLYGYSSSQHSTFKTTGSFFNPGPYAGYLAVILPISLWYMLREFKAFGSVRVQRSMFYLWIRCSIASLTVIAIVIVLPATLSRAAWIAAAISCAFIYWQYRTAYVKRVAFRSLPKKKWLIVGSALLLGMLLAFGLYRLKKDSADGRSLIWKVSINLVERNWFGVGAGYFSGGYGQAQQIFFAEGQGAEKEKLLAGEPQYAFNEFIQIAAELGVFPLTLFVLLLLLVVEAGIRYKRYPYVGGLLALLCFAAFSYPFSLIPFLILLVFLLAACVSVPHSFSYIDDLKNMHIHNYKVRQRWNTRAIVLVLICCIGGGMLGTCKGYRIYQAYEKWGQARLYYDTGMYSTVVQKYDPLMPWLQDQPAFLFEYGQSLLKAGRYAESSSILLRGTQISADPMFLVLLGKNAQEIGQYTSAEVYYGQASHQVPHRLYPLYLLAKLYQHMGKEEEAVAMARTVIQQSAKVDSQAIRDMKAEMKKLEKELRKN